MSDGSKLSNSKLAKLKSFFSRRAHNRHQLTTILRHAEHRHIIDSESLAMIEGVLQVSDMKVRDIMIPRANMTTIELTADSSKILSIMSESKHSRFPVIGENRNEILGIVLAKELLPYFATPEKINLKKIMRTPVFIPESKRLNVLLREFRLNHNHMALVVDEYGSLSGLVTIEDVLEQIVGQIEDESDIDEDTLIHQQNKNRYNVKAWTPIKMFNKHFKTNFRDDEFDTIGGYVMHEFGHLPRRNESVVINSMKFKVLHADNRRIRLLQVNYIK